jgi:hypothetical protein
VLKLSLPNGPLETGEAELLGKLLSGDEVIGGWKTSVDAVLAGPEVVSGNRFIGSVEPLSNPFPESNPGDGSLVEAGNGSFDAVLVGVPKGSLLAETVSGFPRTLPAEPELDVPKGCSLPNGVDELVDGPLSSVPNSLAGRVSFPKPGLLDSAVEDGSLKPPPPLPPLSDVSEPRSNNPVGPDPPPPVFDPNGSFVSELSVDVPNGSLPAGEPDAVDPPIRPGCDVEVASPAKLLPSGPSMLGSF